MRIALVAPLFHNIPPKGYGGTERVVQALTDELVRLGHTVTLYTAGGSRTPAHQIETMPCSMGDYGVVYTLKDGQLYEPDVEPYYYAQMYTVLSDMNEYDIIHCHHETYWLHGKVFKPIADDFRRLPVPVLWTDHMTLQFNDKYEIFEDLALAGVRLTTLSNSQRDLEPRVPWIETVYNGLPENLCRPTGVTPTYLAFLGRCSPEKGAPIAIRIAAAAGQPLRMAGPTAGFHTRYGEDLRAQIKKHNIDHVELISDAEKSDFLSGARALLFPIQWEEPFGLVMIEAMACGTPVVALRRGSVPEVIEDGVTGFVVNTEEEAVEKLRSGAVDRLDRAVIRKVFEQRFTSEVMAKGYVKVYERLCRERGVAVKGLAGNEQRLDRIAKAVEEGRREFPPQASGSALKNGTNGYH